VYNTLNMKTNPGRLVSSSYMALTQSKELADIAEQYDFTPETSAAMVLAGTAAFMWLFNNTSLGEVALSGLGLSDARHIVKGFYKQIADDIAKVGKPVISQNSN